MVQKSYCLSDICLLPLVNLWSRLQARKASPLSISQNNNCIMNSNELQSYRATSVQHSKTISTKTGQHDSLNNPVAESIIWSGYEDAGVRV